MLTIYAREVFAAMALSVLVHELGHALAICLVGGRVRRFRYGWGPVLLSWRALEWRLVPILGAVEGRFDRCETPLSGWRLTVVALSGVAAQWAVLPVVVRWVPSMAAWYFLLGLVGVVSMVWPCRGARASVGAVERHTFRTGKRKVKRLH